MRSLSFLAGLAFALLAGPAPIHAEEPEGAEMDVELLHAPLPLYTFDWRDLWPRSIENPGPDVIAGCESPIAFGDWQFVSDHADYGGIQGWTRIQNYGAFHCAANLYSADDREALDEGEFSRGLFARIGEGRAGGKTYELWVLQKGFIPGSSYILLARDKAEQLETTIQRFEVLQRKCPRGRLRKAEGMDVWSTRYCAIESRAELLALARKMLREPFLGEFRRAKEEGPEARAADPSKSD